MADQTKIQKYLEIVEAKKVDIAKASKPNYITNLTYPLPNGTSVNLVSISDVGHLTQIMSDLLSRASYFKQACEILGYSGEFKLGVSTLYTVKEWTEDIKTRMLVLNLRKNREILEKLEAELLKLESPDVKAQKKLNEIENLLNNL